MKSRINNSITVLATGVVVLLLLSLPLFWGRWLCEFTLSGMMPRDWSYARIQPSGLVPSELENDPNVFKHSKVTASNHPAESKIISLGISDYFESRKLDGRCSNIYYYHDEAWMYFDENIGQIVCTYEQRAPDKITILKKGQLYAGPEGVSETADEKLGRFISPIVERTSSAWRSSLTLYDKKLRRFFIITFHNKTIIKGPDLSKDDIHNPIQIGRIKKGQHILDVYWEPPYLKPSDKVPGQPIPIVERGYFFQYLLVLDETGRIDLLDSKTLEFTGSIGCLPSPQTLFPSKEFVTPKDLLAYEVFPLALSSDHKYRGMFVASVNREGTAMTLAVFDEKGKLIRSDYTKATDREYIGGRRRQIVPSSKAVFFAVPWAPTLTIAKYLLENLHPPILSLASYAMADSFEAGAGHRALFILPNSFIAMKGRDVSKNMAEKLYVGLLIILPSIILSVLLAWRVSQDATAVGLSENTKLFWLLATIAFGLAGYITYRLTRPEITLVTCANCGKLRRPDMEKCHRCGSKWHVPELTPPTWRVVG